MTSDKNIKTWLECVDTMFKWYLENFGPFYDFNHGKNKDKLKHCELIDQSVRADCSGFINACLVLFGELADSLKYNVTHGSYNYNKRRNDPNYYGLMPDIEYFKNDLSNFEHIDIKSDTVFEDGDILYNKAHTVVYYGDYVYDWGDSVEKRDLSKHDGMTRLDHIVDPYKRIQKYNGLWRLKG